MTCHETRERLSELLDEALEPAAVVLVQGHLTGCLECRGELARLRATVDLLHRVEPARAPAGFVDRVILRAQRVPWYRRVGRWLFVPLSIKLPAEAMAVVLVAFLAIYLFERSPELRDAARMEPASRRPAPPAPAAPPREPAAPVVKTIPEATTEAPVKAGSREDVPSRAKAAPHQGTTALAEVAPRPESAVPQESAPRQEAAPVRDGLPPPRNAAEPEAPRPEAQPKAAPSPIPMQAPSPAARAERAAEPAPPAGRSAEAEGGPRRLAASPPRVATTRSAAPIGVVGRLDVRDPAATFASLARLLADIGGAETARRQEGSDTVIEVEMPQGRYEEFVRGLEALGTWSSSGQPIVSPQDPPQIRVSVRVR